MTASDANHVANLVRIVEYLEQRGVRYAQHVEAVRREMESALEAALTAPEPKPEPRKRGGR